MKLKSFSPISKTQRYTVYGKVPIARVVAVLLGICRPSAVHQPPLFKTLNTPTARVMQSSVDSVNGMARRRLQSHIVNKNSEVVPSLANTDALAHVDQVAADAYFHRLPTGVLRRGVFNSSVAVLKLPIPFPATTRTSVPVLDVCKSGDQDISAGAKALPLFISIGKSRAISQHGQSAKRVFCKVGSFGGRIRSGHGLIPFIGQIASRASRVIITLSRLVYYSTTYDATGNVLGTGTAVVGRTMFATLSSSTGKWSMSY